MTFAPISPTTSVPPTRIASDRFVIHQVRPALGQPLFVYLNSMVIVRGREVAIRSPLPLGVETSVPTSRPHRLL